MEKHIGLGVQVILRNQQGQILLLKRKKEIGFGEWEVPGGHLEFGETFEQCISRECDEELGIKIEDIKFISVATNMLHGNHYIIFTFVAKPFEGEIINREPEIHSEIKWFDENELPSNLFISTKDGIATYQNKIFYQPVQTNV